MTIAMPTTAADTNRPTASFMETYTRRSHQNHVPTRRQRRMTIRGVRRSWRHCADANQCQSPRFLPALLLITTLAVSISVTRLKVLLVSNNTSILVSAFGSQGTRSATITSRGQGTWSPGTMTLDFRSRNERRHLNTRIVTPGIRNSGKRNHGRQRGRGIRDMLLHMATSSSPSSSSSSSEAKLGDELESVKSESTTKCSSKKRKTKTKRKAKSKGRKVKTKSSSKSASVVLAASANVSESKSDQYPSSSTIEQDLSPSDLVSPTSASASSSASTNLSPFAIEHGISHDGNESFNGDLFDEEDEYEKELQKRRKVVEEMLEEQDKEFKEERRREVWGDFADAKTKADIFKVEQNLKTKISQENQQKATVAKLQGVEIEMLEALDNTMAGDGSVWDDNGNVRITPGSINGNKQRLSNFYETFDQDLKEEWDAMNADNDDDKGASIVSNGNIDGETKRDNDDNDLNNNLPGTDTVAVNGKIISREALKGVRVGSAGGWSLEVFPGDFVVHRRYGIGRFEGLKLVPRTKLSEEEKEQRDKRRNEMLQEELRRISKESGGVTQDQIKQIQDSFGSLRDTDPISNPQSTVLEITYSDGVVQVPVDRAYRLSRYRAGDSVVKPRLSKVRGDQWKNARKKVQETTLELAQDVLALYATRETLQRQPFDPALENEVKEFEATFQFDPTPDQQKCFEDVENDMVWRSRPMDRLVCGDVGFGKTEVAMRAIYRSVVNGRQAALLAPTGVLASQHFKNVVKRCGEGTSFNKRVALLRGGLTRATKAGQEMRRQIEEGEVDIIVGTHALLSRDLKYHDLGLLVVDEEQRFGVKQKERLKVICGGIDILTLSATPIPRTLQMSLSGVRDTSTIRSPPPMRKPTLTYVQDFSEDVIKFAIGNELDRGGQCYYVVPRIAMLTDAEETMKKLFPDIRVIQAHGRMGRNEAEENVAAFAEGNFDVLLATTVIENGVDIPSVNTIIVQDSQFFGISTLYQLRGRVGRSDLQAYAYFLCDESKVTEQSMLRLQAIGELNELGSGFDVANRDLEIRGAGSLLGTEQSGMAARVGFDLYMRMLKKSIRQLRGLDLPLVPRTTILLPNGEGSMEIKKKDKNGKDVSVHAFQIPESYIPDKKKRQQEESAARLAETSAKLVELTTEWKEKYGPLPMDLQLKLKTMHLHACTRRLGIDLIGLLISDDPAKVGQVECMLRSPGLRPRHWNMIFPNGVGPKGVNAIFPARFTKSGESEAEMKGGKRVDLKKLLEDSSLDDDSENWDALDEEEVEEMKDISSAYGIRSMDEIQIEQYPRLVIRKFDQAIDKHKAVDRILQSLLPIAKSVYEIQEQEKEKAKVAAELREKRSILADRQKDLAETEQQRYFMK